MTALGRRRFLGGTSARAAVVAAVAVVLAGTAAVAAPGVLPRPAAPAPAATPPPGGLTHCPTSTVATASGGAYAIAVQAEIDPLTFNNGYDEADGYWRVRTTGVTAKACGLLELPSLQVVIQKDNLVFDTSKELVQNYFGPAPGTPSGVAYEAAFVPTGAATTTITKVNPDTSLELSAHTPVNLVIGNTPGTQRFSCPPAPIDTSLTTGSRTTVPNGRPPGPQWTVAGEPLTGPFVGATAKLVANDFAIPNFVNKPAPGCDQALLIDSSFGGTDKNGDPYYTFGSTDPTPAGEGQAIGTLTLTKVDTAAIPQGPPRTVPGRPDVPSGTAIKPDCVPTTDPGKGPQLGVLGSFNGGGVQLAGGVSVSNIRGYFCGIASVVNAPIGSGATVCAAVTAPADGIAFDGLTTNINKIPGVTSVLSHVTVTPQAFSALVCDNGVPGPIKLDTVINASAVPNVFGTGCEVGPLVAHLQGSVSGPLRDAKGTATSPRLPVEAVQANGASCPSGLADNTNIILGLPTTTQTGLNLGVEVGLYLPPPAR